MRLRGERPPLGGALPLPSRPRDEPRLLPRVLRERPGALELRPRLVVASEPLEQIGARARQVTRKSKGSSARKASVGGQVHRIPLSGFSSCPPFGQDVTMNRLYVAALLGNAPEQPRRFLRSDHLFAIPSLKSLLRAA